MKRLSAEELRTLYAMIQRLEAAMDTDDDPDSADNRWTIRGIDRETRELAVASAAARGVTVGHWVGFAISRLAAAYAKKDRPKLMRWEGMS